MKTTPVAALFLAASLAHALGPQDLSPEVKEGIPNWPAPPSWSRAGIVPGATPVAGEDGTVSKLGVPTTPLHFVGITPCRIVDTRGNGAPIQGGPFAISESRDYTLTGQCGIPPGAEAVSLNLTVTQAAGPGFVLMYPQGSPPPLVSTLNYAAGDTLANAAVVPLGTGGGITVGAAVSGTHLILDTNGYYAAFPAVTAINALSGAVTLAAGPNIAIVPSGQTLQIVNTAPAAWSLAGNSGTTPGSTFLGTTDDKPLEVIVNGTRAARMEPGIESPNLIGGSHWNGTAGPASTLGGAVIGGGGEPGLGNLVNDHFGAIGGGSGNTAGAYATVPGGFANSATGPYSFAAGRQAKAPHQGSFVWGDNRAVDISSTGDHQFIVRAYGGARFLRDTGGHTSTSSALQAEQGGASGEAAWFFTASSANPTSVLKLLKHASGTNNFLECRDAFVANRCHINSAGTFVAGSDFAEALPARGGKPGYEPGDVLVASTAAPGRVEKTARPYDRRVIGVYSTRPGVLGADKDGDTRVDPDDVPVAITGIVPTKVTDENGAIEPGDLLTTSSTPGFAMKATPVSIAGVEMYATGTILGKALAPLKGGRGVIKVLVVSR